MDLELKCEISGYGDNVRFGYRTISDGILVDVTRRDEDDVILLEDIDVERLYEYLGEYLGKGKESVTEVPIKSTEEVSDLLEMSFNCTSELSDTLYTHFDYEDKELYIKVNNSHSWDENEADVYLSSEDALTMAENIMLAFGSVGIASEPVVEEYEAASKEDLNKVVTDLKELKEDFHNSMESVVKDWSKLNNDITQVRVEISQIQNDVINTNESTKVKLESLGKHIEGVSKEVVAAMETLAGKVDYNFNEIHSLKSENIIRKINEDPDNVKV